MDQQGREATVTWRRLNRLLLVGASVALAIPAMQGADEEKLPDAAVVMDRFVEVTGGKAAYEKRKSEIITIEMDMVGRGIKGTLTRYNDTSNNAYTSGELEGVGKVEEGVFQGQAWENNPVMGPRLKQGSENADSVRDAHFNGAVEWRKLFKAETAGVEKVEGEDCYKVMLTPIGEGKPQTAYFSKKTGLMVKTLRTTETPMGEITVEATASDYQTFDGILVPTKMNQKMMGTEIALTIKGVKSDEEIPKERFEPPAEVKKLLEKK
jgi:zinc protease